MMASSPALPMALKQVFWSIRLQMMYLKYRTASAGQVSSTSLTVVFYSGNLFHISNPNLAVGRCCRSVRKLSTSAIPVATGSRMQALASRSPEGALSSQTEDTLSHKTTTNTTDPQNAADLRPCARQ